MNEWNKDLYGRGELLRLLNFINKDGFGEMFGQKHKMKSSPLSKSLVWMKVFVPIFMKCGVECSPSHHTLFTSYPVTFKPGKYSCQ